jgi:L-asparaginase/archaeal Glu-tRNAGln amidotransferase subunit D
VPAGVSIEPAADLYRINSWDMDPRSMWLLAARIDEVLAGPEVAGIVITHGTDTMEETAFAVDLATSGDKPIVFAAAMRSADSTSADGPRNLSNAVAGAAMPQLRGLGVLVSTSDELHAARWVRKVHTHHVNAFSSPTFGPVATFGPAGRIRLAHRTISRWTPTWPLDPDVQVVAITPYSGFDPRIVRAVVDQTGARGLVLEGFGLGNLPGTLTSVVGDRRHEVSSWSLRRASWQVARIRSMAERAVARGWRKQAQSSPANYQPPRRDCCSCTASLALLR